MAVWDIFFSTWKFNGLEKGKVYSTLTMYKSLLGTCLKLPRFSKGITAITLHEACSIPNYICVKSVKQDHL